MKTITLVPDDKNYDMFWENGVHIGKAIIEADGFYYFESLRTYGLWSAFALTEIAKVLDELNKEWSDKIDQYFKESKDKNTGEEFIDLPF
jgi:hypothetical protein